MLDENRAAHVICSKTGSVVEAEERGGGGIVVVFLEGLERTFKLPPKREGRICAVAKISSTCLRWKLVDLKRW